MKKFFSAAAVCLLTLTGAAYADHLHEGDSFVGGWQFYNSNPGNIKIGDGNGWALDLRGTDRYCVSPGAGYSTMTSYISSNYPSHVSWFVDEICTDGYVRICVYSGSGNLACSTYWDNGWVRLD